MISLIIPPKDQISRVAKMLADEFGTASNIKSRVNRLSVLGAITSVQQRLKLYNKGKSWEQNMKNPMDGTGWRLTLVMVLLFLNSALHVCINGIHQKINISVYF